MARPQTYQVKVYEAPALHGVALGRTPPPKPKELPGFSVTGRNVDDARRKAKQRLAGRGVLQSMSVTRDGHIQTILMHPDDVARDRPSTGVR